MLAIGGSTASSQPVTDDDAVWRLSWDSDTPDEVCELDLDTDGDGLAGCADPDCWLLCTPTCMPGLTCDPAAPHCGDGTCDPAHENCRNCPSDCTSCPDVCGDYICDPDEVAASCPADCTP